MNIALHGLESYIVSCLPKSRRPAVIRYADDLVILHPDLATIRMLKEKAEAWLATIGLNLKVSKTRITHTLHEHEGNLGFDFLGFTVRQFKVSKYHSRKGYKTHIRPSKANQKRHQAKLKEHIYKNRGTSQYEVISVLNPKIRGWANYYRMCCAKRTFARMDDQLHYKLWRWACWRHHNKGRLWRFRRYWRPVDGRLTFTDGHKKLARFADTKIVRHPKVPADKSPFDGDWIYWAQRIGKAPDRSRLSVKLLNTQDGKCRFCKLPLTSEDILEIHHINGNHQDNRSTNLALMHGHCHDQIHNEQMARLRTVRQRAQQLAATC